jgi:hypothetical protein
MKMRKFEPSHDAIHAQTALDIAATPKHVAAVYCEVERWGEIFPATIKRAQVTETGDNWKQIEVTHKNEGNVLNTLILISDSEIGLEESKKRYNASFLNQFEPGVNGCTHYVITAYISLKGIYKALQPCIKGYVRWQARRQMKKYVLDPLKISAEKEHL